MDADVLIAGSASSKGASYILLRLFELTLIEGVTSLQARVEAERNLQVKLPRALPAFRLLLDSAVKVVADPDEDQTAQFEGQADPKDLPLLVAAILNGCHYLVTFNVGHYYLTSQSIRILRPGELLFQLRQQLMALIP